MHFKNFNGNDCLRKFVNSVCQKILAPITLKNNREPWTHIWKHGLNLIIIYGCVSEFEISSFCVELTFLDLFLLCFIISVFRTTRLPSNQYDLRVTLSCWANYTFRVIAYNRVGASDPSPVSESMCTTGTCRPKTNPIGVKASTTQYAPLLIQWDVRQKKINFFF